MCHRKQYIVVRFRAWLLKYWYRLSAAAIRPQTFINKLNLRSEFKAITEIDKSHDGIYNVLFLRGFHKNAKNIAKENNWLANASITELLLMPFCQLFQPQSTIFPSTDSFFDVVFLLPMTLSSLALASLLRDRSFFVSAASMYCLYVLQVLLYIKRWTPATDLREKIYTLYDTQRK